MVGDSWLREARTVSMYTRFLGFGFLFSFLVLLYIEGFQGSSFLLEDDSSKTCFQKPDRQVLSVDIGGAVFMGTDCLL